MHVDGAGAVGGDARREQRRQLGSRPLVALTKFTLHRESDILTELEKVAKRGWALNDQELEIGLRAVAAPIRDSTGRTWPRSTSPRPSDERI